jgi:aspartate kinase
VLALRSVEFARNHGVDLHVRSSFTWEQGTWIVNDRDPDQRSTSGGEGSASDEPQAARAESAADGEPAGVKESGVEDPIISGVVTDVSESKVTVLGVPDRPGISAALFEPLAAANVNVDMIVQNTSTEGATDISFTMPSADMVVAEDIVRKVADEIAATGVTHDQDIAKVSLVGAGMKSSPGIAAKMFRTLADENVNIEMISTSTIRISVVVASRDLERAARALHTAFGLDSGLDYSAPLPERR